MEIKLNLDTKKLQKGLKLTEKQLETLHRRAAKRTTVNVRAIASKSRLGIDGLRRSKVPRARVKPLKGQRLGIWFGLNDIKASEFREKPVQEKEGVRFQGQFYKGYFLARFRHDKLPKSVKRAVMKPKGSKSWVEILVPIEDKAKVFIEREIQPKIEGLFNKNFESAVDGLPHVRKR